MKKSIFIAVIFLILFIFISCNKAPKDTVVFSTGGAPAELAVWEEVIKDFTALTGIKVELNRQPTDSDLRRQGLVVPMKAKKTTPDVFMMDVAWIAQFAASGWLFEFPKEYADKGVFFESIISTADVYNDKVIALPVNVDGGVLYYRKDIAKPPETWEQLVMLSKKHNMPFVWQGAQYEGLVCNFLEYAISAGGGINLESKNIVNSGENIKALAFMKGLIHADKVSPANTYTEMKEEEVRNVFQSGKALFERNWPYAWALHESDDSAVKGKTGIAPLPYFKGNKSASTLGGWHVGVSRYSVNKDKSLRFAEYITSYDVQKKFALKLGWNPAHKSVYKDREVLGKYPHFSALSGVFNNAAARPNVPYYTQLSSILQKHLNSALAGRTEPKGALDSAENEIKAAIKRYE
ncbi:MAG: ABC transporter substrate-binding protein [Candidatus Goldbacteria bacterium]|nr:ABC transporter substrate-binding protein [Candidatus Goldiibacteriota bacterium]